MLLSQRYFRAIENNMLVVASLTPRRAAILLMIGRSCQKTAGYRPPSSITF
jgi:hypothetical protein